MRITPPVAPCNNNSSVYTVDVNVYFIIDDKLSSAVYIYTIKIGHRL